jgi:hypothetical protein
MQGPNAFCHNCIALISANADVITATDGTIASSLSFIFCPFLLVYFIIVRQLLCTIEREMTGGM